MHVGLYVIISRVTNKKSLKILITNEDDNPINLTLNIIYKEIFNNMWYDIIYKIFLYNIFSIFLNIILSLV